MLCNKLSTITTFYFIFFSLWNSTRILCAKINKTRALKSRIDCCFGLNNLREYGFVSCLPVYYWNNSSVQRFCRFLYIIYVPTKAVYPKFKCKFKLNRLDFVCTGYGNCSCGFSAMPRIRGLVGRSVGFACNLRSCDVHSMWDPMIFAHHFWFCLKCCIKCLNVSLDCVAFSWRAMVISI